MMKRVVFLIVAVCFTMFSFAQEQDASEIVKKANAAVESKDYEKAVELFESALAIPNHGQDEAKINSVLIQLKPIVAKDKAKDALDAKEYDKALELYKDAMTDFPDDASIVEQAGIRFYNAGITSYKSKDYLNAIKCLTLAEKEFKYEKAIKSKNAVLKKYAEDLVAEGITSAEEVNVSTENKELLVKSMSNVYFSQGYALYQSGSAIITTANEKVSGGSMTTADDAYKAEVEKGKKDFKAAIPLLEKATELDPSNANAKKVLDACQKSI